MFYSISSYDGEVARRISPSSDYISLEACKWGAEGVIMCRITGFDVFLEVVLHSEKGLGFICLTAAVFNTACKGCVQR